MRIVVLTSLYPLPGLPYEGIFAERRWAGMVKRGHEVVVVQPVPIWPRGLKLGPRRWREMARSPRRELRAGVQVIRPRYLHIPRFHRGNAARFARAGLGVIRERGPHDVMVADYAWPAAMAVPGCGKQGLPTVVSGRGSDILLVAREPRLRGRLASALRAAHAWCAVSHHLLENMRALADVEGAGFLVPNGVDLDLFRIRDREEARRRLGIDHRDPIVLVVGHLIARKRPLLALEAFRRGAPARARIYFVGVGPLQGKLQEAILRQKMGERASLVGELPPERLALWYAACDLLLLCSTREGRPNVVLECLGSGRPVLATDAGGTREILGADEAMLSRDASPSGLAESLADLLAERHDPKALRAKVEHLSWDASLAALEDCLTAGRAGSQH